MFATLVGSDRDIPSARKLLDRLSDLALQRGFARPDSDLPVRGDGQGSVAGFEAELRGPLSGSADFLLAVTAPRFGGMSPIYPFMKTVDGPLFAVVMHDSWYVVYREDERDVSEAQDSDTVEQAFADFLNRLQGVPA